MKLMKYLFLIVSIVIFTSCSGEEEPASVPKEKPGKVTDVETVYEEGQFKKSEYVDLLKELDFCTDEKICLQCATCTPEFFRFFEIAQQKNVKNLFAIQIKALTKLKNEEPLPTREVRVFLRESGSLVRCNRIRGYVIQEITNESGVNDLVVRIRRMDEGVEYFFHCLFQWSDKDQKYLFTTVENIYWPNGGGPVKASEKAATSQQVYTELVQGGFIL
ncbi:MAG: hypothetical protein Crog4KO_01340 [Crocinitomicaceae bacterium]